MADQQLPSGVINKNNRGSSAGEATSSHEGNINSQPQCFKRSWKRPQHVETDSKKHPCIVCHVVSNSSKRCSRCHAATYCSPSCQRRDFTEGQHKSNCKMLGELWKEKSEMESQLWERTDESVPPDDGNAQGTPPTPPNDDELPKVGRFWIEKPITPLEKHTTAYCVCLLKMVQLLGRGESWRLKKTSYRPKTLTDEEMRSPPPGNPLALETSLDLALSLLHLNRTDMRVRLLIPALYLELNRLQDAYDYVKFWLLPSSTVLIMELTQMELDANGAMELSYLHLSGEDMTERPEDWMDLDMLYPSVGMVLELALIKIKMFHRIRRGGSSSGGVVVPVPDSWYRTGAEELERQSRLLLSVAHDLNPNLLPKFASYDVTSAQPAAVRELLDSNPPGFDLQFRMGNPGGRSV